MEVKDKDKKSNNNWRNVLSSKHAKEPLKKERDSKKVKG